jgi:enoyl-CoA hydratase
MPHCLVERRGAILVVTMNRPEARNALTAEMMAGMKAAWDQVDDDPEIRACVLTGAGGAFCAGADLKAMTSSHPGDAFAGGEWDLSVIEPLLKGRRLTKPLIAAVEGPAIAGGTEILQATDIRVASSSARGRAWPSGTTWPTRPMASASAAVRWRPVSRMSDATV